MNWSHGFNLCEYYKWYSSLSGLMSSNEVVLIKCQILSQGKCCTYTPLDWKWACILKVYTGTHVTLNEPYKAFLYIIKCLTLFISSCPLFETSFFNKNSGVKWTWCALKHDTFWGKANLYSSQHSETHQKHSACSRYNSNTRWCSIVHANKSIFLHSSQDSK